MDKLPPLPLGVAPGSGFWNDWYEKLRKMVNDLSNNISWSIITNKPSTLAGYDIVDAQALSFKNLPDGYAGLNAVGRVTKGIDTQEEIISDFPDRGIVIRSPNGNYWRLSINNAGVLTTTALASKP